MNVKIKLILSWPLIAFYNKRSRKIAKKIKKAEGEQRYPMQWRNNYVLKRAKFLFKKYNLKLEVKGFENIPKAPAIMTPNHCSSLDPLIIILALENPNKDHNSNNLMPIFLAKKEIKKKKSLRGWASILDTYFIDRENIRESIKVMEKLNENSKKNKKYQIIFPEGTRSSDGKISNFKGGAFKNAKKYFLPIIPVTINNSFSATNTSRKQKQKIEVIFHPQIKPINLISKDTKNIADNVKKIVESKWKESKGKRPQNEKKI